MKIKVPLSRKIFLLLILWMSLLDGGYAQSFASNQSLNLQEKNVSSQTQVISLKDVLTDLEKKMKISLNYDYETVKNRVVSAETLQSLKEETNVENSLKKILNPLQLNFEKVAENYYVIFKAKKKTKKQKIEPENNLNNSVIKTQTKPVDSPETPKTAKKTQVEEKIIIRTLTGKITNEIGEPVPGVSVYVKGTTIGTVTDANGSYSLNLPDNSEKILLIISSVGFVSQEIELGASNTLDVVLKEDIAKLNEIVVIGYGVVNKSDLTGSVASIKSEEINKVPSFNPLQGLQGKISGVQVSSASGTPGESPVVRIRGTGTFNNSSPLYVVDGVFVDDISFVSPADIESMEVLKDASSTAIYGARGANGVIIVTTKRGKEGKPRISVNGRYSIQTIPQKLDLLNGREFALFVNEIFPGTFNNVDVVPNVDWQEEIFDTPAPLYDFDVSFSGSGDKNSYYVGIGYFNQKGVIPKSSYERLNIKLNNQYFLTNKITFGHDVTISRYERKAVPNVVATAYRSWPTDRPYNDAGEFVEVRRAGNALADLAYTNNRNVGIRTAGSVYGTLKFAKDFTFKTSFGLDADFSKFKSFSPVYFVSPTQQNITNDLNVSNGESFRWVWENTLNYNKKFGEHQLDLLAGYTMQELRSEFLTGNVENLIREFPDVWYLDAGDKNNFLTGGNNGYEEGLISYLFRANYNYKGKYLFTATGRIDGSSKFGANNRYGFFPSFAVGWNISQEPFMQSFDFLDNLKIRASYGVLGNERIDGNAQYARVATGLDGVFGNDETLQPGATIDGLGNPDLKWESTAMLDIGLEIGVLNNRLTGEFDYFKRTTDDILVGITVPAPLGIGPFATAVRNAAKIANSGFEFNIRWNDKIGEVKYQIGILGNTLRNEVINLGGSGSQEFILGGGLGNGQNVTRSSPGNPIGAFYGYQVVGVFQNEAELTQFPKNSQQGVGDLRFADTNGDGVITAADRTFIGSPIPDLIYGFNLSAEYKSISLSLDFQGQVGNEIYNGKQAVRPEIYNYEARVRNRWTGAGTSNTEPRATAGGVNYLESNYFIEDGSFLRLRNVTIAYNLPSALLSKFKLTNGKFYLSGTNLFTITKFTGYSPEIGSNSATSSGIDLGIYPITAIYSFGFNLTF